MAPPLTTATRLLPSAEEATAIQLAAGALFSVQVAPESGELRIGPPAPRRPPSTATNITPSAEQATEVRPRVPGLAVLSQVAPELVEVWIGTLGSWNGSAVAATNFVPSTDEATETR